MSARIQVVVGDPSDSDFLQNLGYRWADLEEAMGYRGRYCGLVWGSLCLVQPRPRGDGSVEYCLRSPRAMRFAQDFRTEDLALHPNGPYLCTIRLVLSDPAWVPYYDQSEPRPRFLITSVRGLRTKCSATVSLEGLTPMPSAAPASPPPDDPGLTWVERAWDFLESVLH